jgi:hypothetical protein
VSELGRSAKMQLSDQTLREALVAYVQTFPWREALREHIVRGGLEDRATSIEAAMDACLHTAEAFLYDYPNGVPWTDDFKREFEDLLVSKHSWLDRHSLDRLLSFAGWLCWHEGLNRK